MKKALMLLPAIMLVGCFTLHRTPQTSVLMTRAPEGRDVKVALSGFAATITEYIPVYGYETVYAHCSALLVAPEQEVTRGQIIALVGSTGHSTGPHLHFEVRRNGMNYNPADYLRVNAD